MKLNDILYAIFILILLIFIIIIVVFVNQIQLMEENWGTNKCSPLHMLFANLIGIDSEENMNECVKLQQESNLHVSMEPVHNAISRTLDGIQSGFTHINDMREKMKKSSMKHISHFMGFGRVFNAISVQVQVMITKLQDTFARIMGITTSIMYIVDGGRLTGLSVWNGPFGNAARLLCFHPDTHIEIYGNDVKKIKDIEIGMRLSKGNNVIGTLKLIGNKNTNNPYYRLYSKLQKCNVFVTGSHYIVHNNRKIKVMDHPDAKISKNNETDEMYCLITDDHFINIGEYKFLDWEYH